MISTPTQRRPARLDPAPRFCAEAVGAEAIEESLAHRIILGVPLNTGEIVILVCRRSWWIDAIVAVAAAAIGAMAAWLLMKAFGRPVTAPTAALVGIVIGCGFFVVEHLRRLYVLTDRRVMRQDRRFTRLSHVEAPLPSVRQLTLERNDVQSRLNVGTVVFKTDVGVIAWSSVGDVERVHEIAQQAVKRYGGAIRGM